MRGGDIVPKSNKELAIDVAIAVINANPKIPVGINNSNVSSGVSLKSICAIIESVNSTLDKIDKDKE